jgi:hypothetical protein
MPLVNKALHSTRLNSSTLLTAPRIRQRAKQYTLIPRRHIYLPSEQYLHPNLLLLLNLPYLHPGDVSHPLAHAHLLPRHDRELKVRRRLEHEHDRAPKAEPAHFLGWCERLPVQKRRGGEVHAF